MLTNTSMYPVLFDWALGPLAEPAALQGGSLEIQPMAGEPQLCLRGGVFAYESYWEEIAVVHSIKRSAHVAAGLQPYCAVCLVQPTLTVKACSDWIYMSMSGGNLPVPRAVRLGARSLF